MAVPLAQCPESTLTDRYQTTIPEAVRKALGLNKRDKICYSIQPNGEVLISRVEQAESDPILSEFLSFLENDIEKNPQQIQVISLDLVSRVQNLVSEVELDLESPLLEEDE